TDADQRRERRHRLQFHRRVHAVNPDDARRIANRVGHVVAMPGVHLSDRTRLVGWCRLVGVGGQLAYPDLRIVVVRYDVLDPSVGGVRLVTLRVPRPTLGTRLDPDPVAYLGAPRFNDSRCCHRCHPHRTTSSQHSTATVPTPPTTVASASM